MNHAPERLSAAVERVKAFTLELGYQRQSFKGAFAAVYGHAPGGQKKRLKDDLQAILSPSEPIPEGGWRDDLRNMPRDGTWFWARSRGQLRLVRYDAPDDRLPMSVPSVTWDSLPTHWQPLQRPSNAGHTYTYDAEGRASSVDGVPCYVVSPPEPIPAGKRQNLKQVIDRVMVQWSEEFPTTSWGGPAGVFLRERIVAALPLPPAPIPVGERERAASIVAGNGIAIADFAHWAANGTTYPNAYQSAVDRAYRIADAILAPLLSKVAELEGATPLIGAPHQRIADCPSWHDCCQCTVEHYAEQIAYTDELLGKLQAAETALNTAIEERDSARDDAEFMRAEWTYKFPPLKIADTQLQEIIYGLKNPEDVSETYALAMAEVVRNNLAHVAKALNTAKEENGRLREETGESCLFVVEQVLVMLEVNSERGPSGHGKLIALDGDQWRSILSTLEKVRRVRAALNTKEADHG